METIIDGLVAIALGLLALLMSLWDMEPEGTSEELWVDALLVLLLLVSIGLTLTEMGVRVALWVTRALVSIGLWLGSLLAEIAVLIALGYWLAATTVTDWIIARLDAWLNTPQPERLNDEAPGLEQDEHDLVRELYESREWQTLINPHSGTMARKLAFRRLALRFHPDRATPENKDATTWCMQEINQAWHAHRQAAA